MYSNRAWLQITISFLLSAIPLTADSQDLVALARSGDLEGVKAALPEAEDIEPATLARPMYFAAQLGHGDIVAFLLERGGPADASTDFGTALQIAARGNHVGIVTMLLDAGANPNLPGGEDLKTPLHDAAERGAIDSAELLLTFAADVNARTKKDHPPIHLAARKGRDDMIAFLRGAGAAPRQVEDFGAAELESADLETGRVAAEICHGCHALEAGEGSTGRYAAPSLHRVVGREKAALDFAYTDALKGLGGTWTPQEINRFIADPTGVAPGTNMGHKGVLDQATRIAIIAYLLTLSEN